MHFYYDRRKSANYRYTLDLTAIAVKLVKCKI